MGSYSNCEVCVDFENNPINKANNENEEIIRNDSYISFHQEIDSQKLPENNLNDIINISKQSEEGEKKEEKEEKEGGSKILNNSQNEKISEEKKEEDINQNIKIENTRIPKKEMPSNKNENKTRNIVNELIELNNKENNNNDIIDPTNINDNKNGEENEKINNDIIIDNISHKSEEKEEKNIDDNIQKDNLVISHNINNKKSISELNIYNIISKNKLEQLQDNSILCNGFLEKIIKIPSKNKFIYNERFCVLTKKNFSYYKSKENYLNLWKPLFSIDLQYIKKIEQSVSDDKTFYLGLICAINDETRQYVKKINTFVNDNEDSKEEFLIGFRTKNKEFMLRWIIVLNYCLDNYQNN